MIRAAAALACALAAGTAAADGPVPAGTPTWAVAIAPSGAEFTLELADTPDKQRLGYMFRDSIGPNEGMLFLFDDVERHGIWMKNCRASLDILWLDGRFRVLHRVLGAVPCPADGPCPSMVPPVPARYVLELAAGSAEAAGLREGDRLVVLWEPGGR